MFTILNAKYDGWYPDKFDNFYFISAIAIFCMLLTYYTWIKAVKSGSILWATMTALAYFYMVLSCNIIDLNF